MINMLSNTIYKCLYEQVIVTAVDKCQCIGWAMLHSKLKQDGGYCWMVYDGSQYLWNWHCKYQSVARFQGRLCK